MLWRSTLLHLTLAASLILTGAAIAGSLEDATTAYERGDYETALRLLQMLTERGNAAAQLKLGEMYAAGNGVQQDFAEAAKLNGLAAEQNDADAQVLLGLLYEVGVGVPRDYVKAHMWLNIAASRYTTSETTTRKIAVAARDLVARKMNPAQIVEANRLASEWKAKAE